MIKAHRLTLSKFVDSAFSGEGARRVGGRWTPPGYPVVYCASSVALAVLETLVHADLSVLPSHHVAEVFIPDTIAITSLTNKELPTSWRSTPPLLALRELGYEWLRNEESVVMALPSVLVPSELNYLVNPLHGDFAKLSIGKPEPFALDARLARE